MDRHRPGTTDSQSCPADTLDHIATGAHRSPTENWQTFGNAEDRSHQSDITSHCRDCLEEWYEMTCDLLYELPRGGRGPRIKACSSSLPVGGANRSPL